MSKKVLMLLSVFAVMFITRPLAAQVPNLTATPEGTVISNTASVAYTDANGNSYSNATGTVSITVGFVAYVDVNGQATYTPASPSAANEAVFTIDNLGNGTDSVSVNATTSTGVTINSYKLGSTPYATLTLLNQALAAAAITGGSTSPSNRVSVTVVYTVGSLYGGQTIPLTLTANSRRSGGVTDSYTTNVSPPVAGGVSVTPNVSSINRLPTGSAAAYSTTFVVSNGANASRTFNLTGGVGGSGTTIGTVNGGTASVTIAGNSTATITVTYTVGNVAAGTVGTVTLTATAQDDNLITSTGTHTVTVIKAALSLTKEVYRDNQTTAITASDRPIPGENIWYKLTITNTGAAAASSLTMTDVLPAAVTYIGSSAPVSWNVSNTAGTITATLTGTLGSLASDVIWIHVTIK